MSLDSALQSVASRVLTIFGTSVTIRRVTVGTYSTATRSQAPTNTDYMVKGRLDNYTDKEIQGTIQAGDRKLTIAAADVVFVPVPHDKAVIGSVPFDVVAVTREQVVDSPALYILQIRQ